MLEKTALLVFSGLGGNSPAEKMLDGAKRAAALDLLQFAHDVPLFSSIIVITNDLHLAAEAGQYQVNVVRTELPFHFGKTLSKTISENKIESFIYVGGAAALLLDISFIERCLEEMGGNYKALVTNNLFSSDMFALKPDAAMLRAAETMENDNNFAWKLRAEAGYVPVVVPQNKIDIDTPTDLLVLKKIRDYLEGEHLVAFLKELALDTEVLDNLIEVMDNVKSTIFVWGRVSSRILHDCEKFLPCQTRVLSEERGMKASGRSERGEVRSIGGYMVSAMGFKQFISSLCRVCDGACIDSRILFSHFNLQATANDRFNSDLFNIGEIKDPWIREFTEEVKRAPIPILLGGHSTISGGITALINTYFKKGRSEHNHQFDLL